jgi:hypothetical protein
MKIKNIKLNKKILALALTGALTLTNTSCNVNAKAKAEKETTTYDFSIYKTAHDKEYYNIIIDDNEYFITTEDLLAALPQYDTTYIVGLKVNDEGNTLVVKPDENPDKTFHCSKKINPETGTSDIVLGGEIYSYEITTGYRLTTSNDKVYDISKMDLDFAASIGISEEESKLICIDNPDGGPDTVFYKKK